MNVVGLILVSPPVVDVIAVQKVNGDGRYCFSIEFAINVES